MAKRDLEIALPSSIYRVKHYLLKHEQEKKFEVVLSDYVLLLSGKIGEKYENDS